MVSKVAVIALVAVLAVPILLGYGMNLTEVTRTTYSADGDVTNVTPLLQNSMAYSYVSADPYSLNTDFTAYYQDTDQNYKIMPYFIERTTNTTPYPGWRTLDNNFNPAGRSYNIALRFPFFFMQFDYNVANGSVTATLTSDDGNGGTITTTITRYHSLYYDQATSDVASYSYYNASGNVESAEISKPKILSFTTSDASFRVKMQYYNVGSTTDFINLSKGYYFDGPVNQEYIIGMPQMTKSVLFTINLDSVTSPYRMSIFTKLLRQVYLDRSSQGWTIQQSGEDPIPIYRDPSISDNTYQVLIEYTRTGLSPSYNYDVHIQFRYVGHWPMIIGAANYYQTYDLYRQTSSLSSIFLDDVRFIPIGYTRTPTIRMDDAQYPGFEYPVIEEKDYDPSSFKQNPITTFSSITQYGSSIEFAGNTYDVDNNGDILLGVHKTSLNGMRFESVPVATGYENRINGNPISTTANPSMIGFNGIWALSVSTDSQTAKTTTDTEWIPGQFAWDGIDHNFLIVGLITALGAFIGLAIYSRRSKTALWPLLIVCGCAAMLFLFML